MLTSEKNFTDQQFIKGQYSYNGCFFFLKLKLINVKSTPSRGPNQYIYVLFKRYHGTV